MSGSFYPFRFVYYALDPSTLPSGLHVGFGPVATSAMRDRFVPLRKGQFHMTSIGYNKNYEPDTKVVNLLLDLTDFQQVNVMFAPLIQSI